MNFYAAHIAAEEAHTARLARIPGWRNYIKAKADAMAKWQPALYGHLPQIVADTIAMQTQPPTNQEKPDAIPA